MHAESITSLLFGKRATALRTVRGALAPAPHAWPHFVRHAALHLDVLDAALGDFDASVLPGSLPRAVRTRQLTFVGGRVCAEAALSELGVATIAVGRDDAGVPLWPPLAVGTITHTDACAYAAVAPAIAGVHLGADTERIATRPAATAIAESCCTSWERDNWLGGACIAEAATIIYCAKEAYYKAVYPTVQRVLDYVEVEVRQLDRTRGIARIEPHAGPARGPLAPPAEVRFALVGHHVHASTVVKG